MITQVRHDAKPRKPRGGSKPKTDEQLAETSSWRLAARRKAAKAQLHLERIRSRRRGGTRIYDPRKTILELPGYDPHADAAGFEFDPRRARAAIGWIQDHITHVKGELALEPLQLSRWEQGVLASIFGWYEVDTGLRRYREALVFVPRKNDKTTLAAAILAYLGFNEEEPGAELYSAAADRHQAAYVFGIAREMIRQDERIIDRARIYHASIVFDDGAATYKPLSREAGTKHGLNASAVVIDELHALRDRELVDVLVTSTAARRQPIVISITTSDWDRPGSICNEKHEYASKVRDGVIKDPTFLPVIYEASREDNWRSPAVWKKANPNYGKSIKVAYLRKACQRAIDEPAFENEFKRLHLNIRTEQAVRVIALDRWDHCGRFELIPDALVGRDCYGGLDIGATSDLTSLCLVFPDDDDQYDVLWWFWSPREKARFRSHRDRVPYLDWARDGWLTLTEGNETDYGAVRRDINAVGETYNIVDLAADRLFQGAQLCQELAEDGFNLVAFGQGFYDMAAPTAEFLRLVRRGTFYHGGNPIARWMASNLVVKGDEAGNVKPDKRKSAEKIDGLVASIMSLGRILARARKPAASVYEGRGLIEL
jgi:phage terminase large subunit-like protein